MEGKRSESQWTGHPARYTSIYLVVCEWYTVSRKASEIAFRNYPFLKWHHLLSCTYSCKSQEIGKAFRPKVEYAPPCYSSRFFILENKCDPLVALNTNAMLKVRDAVEEIKVFDSLHNRVGSIMGKNVGSHRGSPCWVIQGRAVRRWQFWDVLLTAGIFWLVDGTRRSEHSISVLSNSARRCPPFSSCCWAVPIAWLALFWAWDLGAIDSVFLVEVEVSVLSCPIHGLGLTVGRFACVPLAWLTSSLLTGLDHLRLAMLGLVMTLDPLEFISCCNDEIVLVL